MQNQGDTTLSHFPLLRVHLCGPLQITWNDSVSGQELSADDSSGSGRDRAAALSLLALLLRQPNRRAHRDWVMEQFWPEGSRSVAVHRLENIFSCLRKLLRPPGRDESLVRSMLGKKTSGPTYCIEAYPKVWVDMDALTCNIEQACRMERFGDDALPFWQQAFHLLKRGPFLADSPYEPYAAWVYDQREQLHSSYRQCVHALSRLYLARHVNAGKAEALLLLRTYWQHYKTDEDALRPLLELLGEQERYQEAEEYYQQLLLALADLGPDEEGRPRIPDLRTQDIREYLKTKKLQPTQRVQHLLLPISSELPVDPHLSIPPLVLAQESHGGVDLFHLGITALILHQQQSGWNIHELEQQVTQALDNILPEVQKMQLSRRDILRFIVSMPLALYDFTGVSRQSSKLVPQEVIPLYAAGIPACWRLYYEGGQTQLEHVLPRYISHLTLLTRNPSKLQKNAAGLLSQAYQLMALLAQSHEHFDDAIEYCQHAAFYGGYAEDANLQVMAYIRLQDTYWEQQVFDKCFTTLKQAELLAENTTLLLRGRIFARLANIYSYRSELTSAQHYIDLAQQTFPQHPEMDPSFLYSHTTHFVLYANEVSARIKLGQLQRARDAVVNAEKFVLGPANPRKIDVTQYQIQVAVALEDLEQCAVLFEKLIYYVKKHGQELDRRNTYTLFQSLHEHWPHEARVEKMKQALLS